MKKKMVLVPIGGLANRFYAIASAIGFCAAHMMDLKIIWFKDKGLGAAFHSVLKLSEGIKHVEVVDAGWKEWVYDRPRKKNLWLPWIGQRIAFGGRIYEKAINEGFSLDDLEKVVEKNQSVYLIHFTLFYDKPDLLKTLQPVDAIQRKVEERIRTLSLDKHMIGLHIRRGDHMRSKLNSPLSLFVDKIKEEIEKDPTVRFYVASDDQEEKRTLMAMFGTRIVSLLTEVKRDNYQGIADALVELYTLSSMKKIYGSVASTYSLLAAQLSDIPLQVLSIDSSHT